MVKIRQNSFLGGQLDFEMMGRQDYTKYQKGASVLRNFNILKRGGITKRQGFDRIADLESLFGIDKDTKVRIVPFGYKKDHGFVLLFAPGMCYALCTVSGSIFKSWSIPYSRQAGAASPFGSVSGTENEINEFDYAQCGYRLFLAHHAHKPSVISTTESMINAALEDPHAESPFTWEELDMGGVEIGVPSITSVLQERIAPGEDNAGGLYTEKYKVSAVFDDTETKPCREFYNESYIRPISISSSSGGTCIQRSDSTTTMGTVEWEGKRAQSISTGGASGTSYTLSAGNTNTSAVYTNRKRSSCNGTRYYLPWVESQSIKLNIQVSTKGGKYPDRINVYKKAGGYYGLIGTVNVGNTKNLPNTVVLPDETEEIRTDIISTDKSIQHMPEESTPISVDSNFSEDPLNNAHRSAYVVESGKSVDVDFVKENDNNIVVRLDLGKAKAEMTENSGSTTYGWKLPVRADFKYIPSECSSLKVTVRYCTSDDGTTWSAEKTTHKDIAVDPGERITKDYADYRTSYANFKKNWTNAFNEWAGSLNSDIKKTRTVEIKLNSFTYDSAAFKRIIGVSIVPTGKLVLGGISVAIADRNVEFTDNNIIPDSSITPIDSESKIPFQEQGDYPSTVCISQQRLVWGSSDNQPEAIWMSAIGDFGNYVEHEIQKDDDSIEFDMPVTRFAKMNHLVEMRQLIAFNAACEWLISSSSAVKGITYETVQARPQSYSGSNARLKPLICNNSVVFSERTGQNVRRFSYSIQDDGFAGRDISVLASSIFDHNSIVDWTYQQQPFSTVWCVLSDGTLASLTLMEEQEIIAWGTHSHGGGKIRNVATSYAMSPSLSEIGDGTANYELATHEETFAIVEVNGHMYLERMRVRSEAEDTVYNSLCMDSVRVLNPTNRETPTQDDDSLIWVDGYTGEKLTFDEANEAREDHDVYEGYPFEAKFTSVYPVLGQYVGQGQFDIKNITNIGLRLEASCGGEVESEGKPGDKEPIRYKDEAGEDLTPIVGGGRAKFFNIDAANVKPIGVNTRDGRITITQDRPWPFTLLSYEADYATEGESRHDYRRH